MKLVDIYKLAVDLGKRYDIRGNDLSRFLQEELERFDRLTEAEKEHYDLQKLEHPYSDTRILSGDPSTEVHTILCGIDMETPEILLADRLNQKGHKIDLVLAHHPEGIAAAALYEVMRVQADMLEKVGVPINVGEGIMASRISEVERRYLPVNHQRAVDAARLLDIPFMCVHSPADNLVQNYLDNIVKNAEYSTLDDLLKVLQLIPEYHQAQQLKAGPKIIVGNGSNRTGKVFIKMTGGTAGAEKAYEKLALAGVGTIICMHMSDKHRTLAKENNLNVIISGHMASDSLGMNLFLDELEKNGISIIPCSGLIRVSRVKDHDPH